MVLVNIPNIMQHILPINTWQPQLASSEAQEIINHLESGKIIYLPNLKFELESDEQALLHSDLIEAKAKSIAYFHTTQSLGGIKDETLAPIFRKMMSRYQQMTLQLLNSLRPQYQLSEHVGGTTYRPVEIKGRSVSSTRRDDRLLHVDAFRGKPTHDRRILRVFSNINPYGESRHWQLGEPYAQVAKRFVPGIRPMFPLEAEFLMLFNVTRNKRSSYDHYMLNIHNLMKADADYQAKVNKTDVHFPPHTTWIVYTDLVSHAALSGRYVLEQTFNPPMRVMQNPELSTHQQIEDLLSK